MVRAAEPCIQFGLLCGTEVRAHGVGPGDLPDVEPWIGLHRASFRRVSQEVSMPLKPSELWLPRCFLRVSVGRIIGRDQRCGGSDTFPGPPRSLPVLVRVLVLARP
ncbi:hypothetical protein StoSoilB20_40840 [Arthrobacter sp. StoSoilB20]|nr:hypothetical protein StoSoilB20_40840 [Arthrobacter sp. StoSoilB20]